MLNQASLSLADPVMFLNFLLTGGSSVKRGAASASMVVRPISSQCRVAYSSAQIHVSAVLLIISPGVPLYPTTKWLCSVHPGTLLPEPDCGQEFVSLLIEKRSSHRIARDLFFNSNEA